MPHFSPPLPFQQGRAECRRVLARDLGGPDWGRPRVPGCGSPPSPAAGASSTSAGLSGVPAGAGLQQSPDPRGRRIVDLCGPERGARGCRAVVVPRPPQPARRQPRPARAGRQRVPGCGGPPTPTAGAPSTSAGQSGAPARAGLRWSRTPLGRLAVDLGRPEQGARTCQAAAVPRPLQRARRRPRLARHPCRWGPSRRSPRGPSAAGRDRRNLKLARRTDRWPAEASAGPRRPCPIFTLLLILLTTPS